MPPAIDVGEIEQDVRDHVGAEFEGRVGPVSIEELDAVLHRLGSPRQWAAEHTLALAEQTAGRSNDWLAYAAAGSMVIFMAFPPRCS